jgi:hypothetical protein
VARSFRLLAVAVLAVVMAASMFSLAAARFSGINVGKVTTNGDTTTLFHFILSSEGSVVGTADLAGGTPLYPFDVPAGTFILQETVPSGWALRDISCGLLLAISAGGGVFAVGSLGVASYGPQFGSSTWTVNLADHSVTINLAEGDYVSCTFTNSPAVGAPVGGFVEPINQLAVVGSYFALAGLIAAAAVAAVAIKKRHEN